MVTLYSLAFITSVLSLILWLYFQKNNTLSNILRWGLTLSLLAYAGSMVFSAGPAEYKLGVAFRDVMVMGVTGLVFLWLAKKKVAFFIGLLTFMVGLYWFFKTKLTPTFPFVAKTEQLGANSLDPTGEIFIELGEAHQIESLQSIIDQYDLQLRRAFFPEDAASTELDDYYLVNIPDDKLSQLEEIKTTFQNSGLIDWLEENETVSISPLETEEKLPSRIKKKFGINDPGLEHLWGFEKMEVDKLFAFLSHHSIKPKKTALIAILDTGVDAKHEDIKGNYKSIKSKHDNDPRGHGTHCAGIAASVTNNGIGVASFSPNGSFVQVTSIKVLNSFGSGTQNSIINGIIEAADNKADVISMSLGGFSSHTKQRAYSKAVAYANKKGAVVIAAAGNSNRNAKDYSPVNATGIIGVSAIDETLNKAVFSNFVSDIKMGIAAPGVGIYSTIPDNKYTSFNGTSMATPYVSGLVGLMKSIKPELNTKEVYEILNKTGKETQNTALTGKLIQPHLVIQALQAK